MKADVLIREFADRVVKPNDGRLLLRPADAIELVDRAAEEGVPIVRVSEVNTTDSAVELATVRDADFSSPVREGTAAGRAPTHSFASGADSGSSSS